MAKKDKNEKRSAKKQDKHKNKKDKKKEKQKGMKMYQHEKGKRKKISMEVGDHDITDTLTNKKLVKLSKIQEIHLGKASKGLDSIASPHNVCFCIIIKKTFGRETLDFETKDANDRTDIVLTIMAHMQMFGLEVRGLEVIKSNVLDNMNRDEILEISLNIGADEMIRKMEASGSGSKNNRDIEGQNNGDSDPMTQQNEEINGQNEPNPNDPLLDQFQDNEWMVQWHIDGYRQPMEMVVESEYITDKERQMMEVSLKNIRQISLWNGSDGFQDAESPRNVCLSIVQLNGTEWETFDLEMRSPEDRTEIWNDIISKMEILRVFLSDEDGTDGLPQDIVLESAEESLQIKFQYYPEEDSVVNQENEMEVEKGLEVAGKKKTKKETQQDVGTQRTKIELAHARQQLATKKKEMTDLKTQHKYLEFQKDAEISRLKAENEALKKQMEADPARAEAEMNQWLQSHVNKVREESAAAHPSETDIDKAKTDCAKTMLQLKMVNDDLSGKYQKLEEELSGKMKENENLKNEMNTVRQDTSSEIQRLQSELDANQMAIDKLKKRESELKELAFATSPELRESYAYDLTQQLAALEVRCHEMEQKFDAEKKVNQDLKEQLANDREKNETTNNRLKSDLDSTRSELEEQRKLNEIQRNEIEEQRKQNQLMREKSMLGEQNEEPREDLRSDVHDLRKELASKQMAMDQHMKSFEKHKAVHKEVLKQLEISTLNYYALKKQYDKETEVNVNLRNELFILSNRNPVKGTMSRLNSLQCAIRRLKEQKAENDRKCVDPLLKTVYKLLDVGGCSDCDEGREIPCYEDLMEKQKEIPGSSNICDCVGNGIVNAQKSAESIINTNHQFVVLRSAKQIHT